MKSIFITVLITLYSLCCAAQYDTINALPYAQLVLPKGKWEIKKQSQGSDRYTTRISLVAKEVDNIAFKIVFDEEEESMMEAIADIREKYEEISMKGEADAMMDIIMLTDSVALINATLKPTICSDDNDFFRTFKDGITMSIVLGKIWPEVKLEIEPDLEMADMLAKPNLEIRLRELIAGMHVLTPTQADSIAHYPYTPQYVAQRISQLNQPYDAEEREKMIFKMKCLDATTLRKYMSDYYGKATIDSLYTTGDEQAMENLYVKMKKEEENNDLLLQLKKDSATQYTYAEHIQLDRNFKNKVYPLRDYLDAEKANPRATEITRRSELEGNLGAHWARMQPAILNLNDEEDPWKTIFEYSHHTYMKALAKELLADSAEVIFAETNDKGNGIFVLMTARNKQEKEYHYGIIFRQQADEWTHSMVQLPAANTATEKQNWTSVDTKLEALTVLKQTGNDNYYLQYGASSNANWLTVTTNTADTTMYVLVSGPNNGYNSFGEMHFHRLKQEGVYDAMMAELDEEATTTEEFDQMKYENPDDWMTTSPGHVIRIYNVQSFLRDELHPTYRIKTTKLLIEDLNGDKLPELFHYGVSNGKVIYLEMYTIKNEALKKMKNSKAIKLLMKTNDFREALLGSQYGNYEGYHFLKKE